MYFDQKYRSFRRAVLFAACASGALGVATVAAAQSATTTGGTDRSAQVGEVVVTASRREGTIRETPIAVSAYSGQQLTQEHVSTFNDLATQSPNIHLGFNGRNTNISIRGIGTNLQGTANDPGVAFHIDGSYVADPGIALATLFDVNRVEVLRGPQGTLFGRNATGGAVNIISNTPTTTPSFGFDATAGLPAGEHTFLFASGPLTSNGTLLGRVAVQQTYKQGDVKNTVPTGPKRLNNANDYAVQMQLEWRPTDDFKARLVTSYQKSDTTGSPYYYAGSVARGLPAQLANTFIAKPGDSKIGVGIGDVDLMERSASLIADWNIGSGSLRGTVTRRHTKNDRMYDGDGTPVLYIDYVGNQTKDTTTAELLYSSDGDKRFSYIVGANYYDDSTFADGYTYVPFVLVAPIVNNNSVVSKSSAVFGQATYKISDDWKVFAGGRYTKDKKTQVLPVQSSSWSKPTFEIGTSYDFNPTTTGYVKYATGYKGGGFSNAVAFDPETNKMWELGLKGTYFDGLIQANLALFRMHYKNLQVQQIRFTVVNGVGVSGSAVTNAGVATLNGAEGEFSVRLSPELRVQVDGGWLDARFDSFTTGDAARVSLGALDLAGNTLPNAPKFTVGIGPIYTHSLANGGQLTLGARYDWKSRVYFSEFNLPLVSQAASGRWNAYANYDMPGGKWQVGLYGRNLADQAAYGSLLVYSTVLNSMVAGTLKPRRELGMQLRYRY